MTPPSPIEQELAKETQDFIRFMLRDHAFSEDFLVTAIQEYFWHNNKR